jgi:hypothetical protein
MVSVVAGIGSSSCFTSFTHFTRWAVNSLGRWFSLQVDQLELVHEWRVWLDTFSSFGSQIKGYHSLLPVEFSINSAIIQHLK